MLEGEPPHRYFWHGGAHPGCRTLVLGYLDQPFAAALLTSSTAGAERFIDPALAAIADDLGWPALELPT